MQLRRYDTLDSTQLCAHREIHGGRAPAEPTAYCARQQTGGLGRLGRPWWSPRGGVWLTAVFPLARRPAPGIALAVGCAICEACEEAAAREGGCIHAQVKWPNDIMLDDRKLAGILIEATSCGGRSFLLVGVGINANLNIAHLPAELGERATSLQAATGSPIDLERLTHTVVGAVEQSVRTCMEGGPVPLAGVRDRLWGVGRTVPLRLPGGPAEGVIQGIALGGELIALVQGRVVQLSSAELDIEPAPAPQA